eukprot:GHUV01048688.1.p1 GENE.GHUV01048688.1~~GHUV01048688.1.p1  ORF type:complete len:122 (+),score=26.72 GHUV01048688.1:408-773(+)
MLPCLCIQVNAELSQELGIPQAAAVTCVKPSGTVSQLVDSASGIHPRHSQYYIRRVRCNKDDPLTAFMVDHGVPMEDCVMNPASTAVFSFPIKAPEGRNLFRGGGLVRCRESALCRHSVQH